MQPPYIAQRGVAFRTAGARAQSEASAASDTSKAGTEAGDAAEAGSAETALLQPDGQSRSGGDGPGGNPLLGQLCVFGRYALQMCWLELRYFSGSAIGIVQQVSFCKSP